jgi:alkylation response protein AidB-like acyl-CoA dehydrogenase
VLLTSAFYDDPTGGPTVLHFSVPLTAAGVTIRDTGRTMGMRACGAHEVVLDGVYVPEAAVSFRRPRGAWAPLLNALPVVAGPLIMAVYLGVAEAARDLALQKVATKREDPDVWYLTGEMENALVSGQMAVQALIALCADYTFTPDVATANAALIRKTIAAQALQQAVETALETVGRSGLLRGLGLERLVRDIHAAQFHQLPTTRQRRFSGRVALGLDPLG